MSVNNIPSVYQAMAVTQFGEPEVLKLITRQMPVLNVGEVLIKLLATSINPIDYKTRAGLGWAAAQNKDNLPFVLGYDCFGEVVDKNGVDDDIKRGDKSLALLGFPLSAGAYGEYAAVNVRDVVKLNDNTSNEIAALPIAGLTAYQGLFDFGQLVAGQTVVISGAAGGVGYLAVQLALNSGANVIAIAAGKDHHLLDQLGTITLLDYNDLASFNAIGEVDLWFDLIGGKMACQQLEQVASIKRLVTVPTITAAVVCDSVASKGTAAQGMLIVPDIKLLTKLAMMVEKQQLKLNISKYININDAAKAHQAIEAGDLKGKVVLTYDKS